MSPFILSFFLSFNSFYLFPPRFSFSLPFPSHGHGRSCSRFPPDLLPVPTRACRVPSRPPAVARQSSALGPPSLPGAVAPRLGAGRRPPKLRLSLPGVVAPSPAAGRSRAEASPGPPRRRHASPRPSATAHPKSLPRPPKLRRKTRWQASNGPAAALPRTPSPCSAATGPQSTTPASIPPSRSSSPGKSLPLPAPVSPNPSPILCTASTHSSTTTAFWCVTHALCYSSSAADGELRAWDTASHRTASSVWFVTSALCNHMRFSFGPTWCDGNSMRFFVGLMRGPRECILLLLVLDLGIRSSGQWTCNQAT